MYFLNKNMRYTKNMLIQANTIIGMPVLSLHTAEVIAEVSGILIDPGKLEVAAFWVDDGESEEDLLLLPQDIRDAHGHRIFVDSHDVFAEPGDLLRLKPLLEKPFEIVDLPVITTMGRKMGKVESFAIHIPGLRVRKLYINPTLMQRILRDHYIVDRKQVVDVKEDRLVVEDTELRKRASAKQPEPAA